MIVIGILFLVGAIGASFAWRMTAGAAGAADQFLRTTASQGPAAARSSAAPMFQANAPAAAWGSFARQSGLTGYKSSSWTKREVSNNVAHLEGSVATQSGATIPLIVELVKTNGKWLVQLIRAPETGFRTDSSAIGNPTSSGPAGPGASPSGMASPAPITPAGSAPAGPGNWPSNLTVSPTIAEGPAPGSQPTANQSGDWIVPGAKIAGICMTKLREQAGLKLDTIECLSGLPARAGATMQCAVSKGALRGQMTVTVETADPATRQLDIHCDSGT